MKTLIIPDVHERLDKLAKALSEERLERVGRIVSLGDWFDTFKPFDADRLNRTIEFIMAGQQLNGVSVNGRLIPVDWLIGNHDVHYFFDNGGYACSGYHPHKKEAIKRLIPAEVIRRFKVFTYVGPYLCSHAGFHPTIIAEANEAECQKAIENSLRGDYDALFGAGRARGGYQAFGGPTWLDWRDEFIHIPGKPQIVGHTNGKEIRATGVARCEFEQMNPGEWYCLIHKSLVGGDVEPDHCDDPGFKSWCIDTGLNHVAIVDEDSGEVNIEEVI